MEKDKILNVSDFFKYDNSLRVDKQEDTNTLIDDITPVVLGAFLRRAEFTEDNEFIFAYFSFRESKFCMLEKEGYKSELEDYCNNINMHSGKYAYWQLNDGSIEKISTKFRGVFILNNDWNLNNDNDSHVNNFTEMLLNKIRRQPWFIDETLIEDRKDFLRGYFDTGCSYDGSNFMACDYYCKTKQDLFKLHKTLLDMEAKLFPVYYGNFNARLTKETKDKADQFRINVKYYWKEIGSFSRYKALVINKVSKAINGYSPIYENGIYTFNVELKENSIEAMMKQQNKFFSNYRNFLQIGYGYRVEKQDSDESMNLYREYFSFDVKDKVEKTKKRSQKIRYEVLNEEADECVCCKRKYNIKDRSYLQLRRIGDEVQKRYYFEVHHVISLCNQNELENNVLDVNENLVKLCPTCHRCLTGKSGLKEDIYVLLHEILHNSEKVMDFSKTYFNTDDEDELVNDIYKNLR